MNKRRIGVGCISIGSHAKRNILPAIEQCKDVQLIGCFTRNDKVLNEIVEEYSCKHYSSEQELLNDKNISLIYISSPTSCHAKQTKAALSAGKSVLVEKTAFSNFSDAKELEEIASSKGLIIYEAFMYRFHEQFKTLKKLVLSEQYGKLLKINSTFGFPHLVLPNIRYSKSLDGGALMDAGAYTVSAFTELTQGPFRLLYGHTTIQDNFEIDTSGEAIIKSSDGVIGICSWAFGGSYINELKLWFEDALIEVPFAFSKASNLDSFIYVKRNGKVIESFNTGCDNHFINMFEHVAKCVRLSKIEENKKVLNQLEILTNI